MRLGFRSLDIPGNDRGFLPKFRRLLTSVTGALIAPQYRRSTAWSQRQTAKKIPIEEGETCKSQEKNEGNGLGPRFERQLLITVEQQAHPESQTLSRRHPWAMTRSFWAIMGVISIDASDSDT